MGCIWGCTVRLFMLEYHSEQGWLPPHRPALQALPNAVQRVQRKDGRQWEAGHCSDGLEVAG